MPNCKLIAVASVREFEKLFPQIQIDASSCLPVRLDELYDAMVCGVGMLDFSVNLSFALLQKRYEAVYQLGICGAYVGCGLNVGDVVRVDSEVLGDMGVQERNGEFTPWERICGKKSVYTCGNVSLLPKELANLPSVAGVTVNCCTGTQSLSVARARLFNAQVESMEGAACFAVCDRFNVPCYEFRAVSNIATDRDPSQWKIDEALENLKCCVKSAEGVSW